MNAIIRVCWLFFSAFPVQRWLSIFGAALLFIALGSALFATEWRISVGVGIVAFLVFAIFPAAISAGGVLRALSAPHSHQLLPFFRVRALLSTALLMALLMTPLCLLFLGPAAPNGRVLPTDAAVLAFGALTAMVLAMFVISGQWNWMFPVLTLFFVASFWANSGGPRQLVAAGLSPAALVGAAASGAWAIFVVWYLRVRRIRPPMLTPGGRASRPLGPSEVVSHATAIRALVNGVIEKSPIQACVRAVGLGGVVGAAIALLGYLAMPPNKPALSPTFIWPFVMMIIMAETVYRLVRQSRSLWLYVPGSRADVFRVMEVAVARRYFWIAAFNLTLVTTVVVARSPVQPEIGWGLALALSAALYGTYVGLAAPATLARLILCCAPMAVVQIAVLGTSGAASGQALTALLAVQIVGAVAFRILATRRWRQIDWMSFRPLRSDFL